MSQRLPSNFIARSPANAALTAAQKGVLTRRANREAERLRDEALVRESAHQGMLYWPCYND